MTTNGKSKDLSDRVSIPRVGLGTWNLRGAELEAVVQLAIELGYRSFDTAAQYGNETAIGRAIRRSAIPREEIFVTTKVGNTEHRHADALKAAMASIHALGLEQLDLLLIHWPVPSRGLYPEAWQALQRLQADGFTRAIGVSNFEVRHLNIILQQGGGTIPAINQIELHPMFQQSGLRRFHELHGITSEAWSPLAKGQPLLSHPTLLRIATKYQRTAAQVVIRWHLELGNIVIPKASSEKHLRENLDVYTFELDADDLAAIQTLGRTQRIGEDPELVE